MRKIKFILLLLVGISFTSTLSAQTSSQSIAGVDLIIRKLDKTANLSAQQTIDVKAAINAVLANHDRSTMMNNTAARFAVKNETVDSIEGLMTSAQLPAFNAWKAKFLGN